MVQREQPLSFDFVNRLRDRLTGERTTLMAYLLITGLLILLLYPALGWLVRSWLSNPYYTHGFLIPPLAALLAWRHWRPLIAEPRQSEGRIGLPVTLVSLAAVVWALRWQNYVVASLAGVSLLFGILLYLEGWTRLRHWLFPLFFLTLMVPLPFVDRASPWFESFTAHAAAGLARLVGIAVVQQGGELSLPGTTLVVGAPCSGLRSLVAMFTVAVGWIYLIEGRAAAKALLLAAVVPLALFSNVLRIAILLAVALLWGQKPALTFYHHWSSPVLFLLALGLLLALSKGVGCGQIRDDLF